jgi:hypothetical protein
MLEEYSVRSSDATDDIVYSEFSGSGSNIRESDLISITNEIYNNGMSNNEINNGMSNNEINNGMSNNLYKTIFIFCSIVLFILVLILLYLYFN